jgi:hypothetical protein
MKPITDLAAKLRALRVKNRDLARWLGVHEATVCRWLRGERPAPLAVEALIDILHSRPLMAERHLKGLRTDDWSAPVEFERKPKRTSQQVKLDKLAKDIGKLETQSWERGVIAERFVVPSGAPVPKDLRQETVNDAKRAERERHIEAEMDQWLGE